jgi:hypothetical protein
MPDALWTPADLARFLGYAESTVIHMVSKRPDGLPPRVPHLHKPRWVPSVCQDWALGKDEPVGQPRKPGRPRRRHENTD